MKSLFRGLIAEGERLSRRGAGRGSRQLVSRLRRFARQATDGAGLLPAAYGPRDARGSDQDKNKEGTNRRPPKRDSDSRRNRVDSWEEQRRRRIGVNRLSSAPLPVCLKTESDDQPGGQSGEELATSANRSRPPAKASENCRRNGDRSSLVDDVSRPRRPRPAQAGTPTNGGRTNRAGIGDAPSHAGLSAKARAGAVIVGRGRQIVNTGSWTRGRSRATS